jgi:hypothetical protein
LVRPVSHFPSCIKIAANKRDVPYQSLIKTWLAGGVRHRKRQQKRS